LHLRLSSAFTSSSSIKVASINLTLTSQYAHNKVEDCLN